MVQKVYQNETMQSRNLNLEQIQCYRQRDKNGQKQKGNYHMFFNRKEFGQKTEKELMAIIGHGEMLSAEWLNEDDVDLLGVSIPQEINETATIPIIAIEDHLTSIGKMIEAII
ncbi:hypothetical protein CHS0354_021871 [Potamilus streckersoni]|uniref:Uncharacterized protein n=1 Tax=Potamilus streckersoni TaxID=2493646 RepID=A0AAE0TJJ1_9BIVA|nr:hypothetical protein CHS0354_021871 [Potamilus streckersoni]